MQIGTGLQNKMLEAMAMKLPCVTTELVNNPIGTTHEKHLFVGQKPIEFAGFVKQLLNDEKLAETIGNNGHDFVRSHFSWAYHVKLLNEIIEGR
jgi:glycosyltransferase involved in cell wall biosynthesis